MKRLILVSFLMAGLFAAFSVAGNAQNTQYSAKIPFDFTVRGKRFQAGEYTITPLSAVTSLRALYLRNTSTGAGKVIGPVALGYSDSVEHGRIIFTKADNGWVLQSVETATFVLKLQKSPKVDGNNMASDVYSSETRTVSIGN
jgi:hypothetical protein